MRTAVILLLLGIGACSSGHRPSLIAVVDEHHEALAVWRSAAAEGTLLPGTTLVHFDAHEDMGIPAAFYWRTLSAAPPEDIHWMTEEELERFGFFTDGAADEE